jgi:hypothetical protein
LQLPFQWGGSLDPYGDSVIATDGPIALSPLGKYCFGSLEPDKSWRR